MKVFVRTPLNIDRLKTPQGQVFIIPERCKGCEICVRFCPQQVLQVSGMTNSRGYHYPEPAPGKEATCVHCEFCTLVCPEFAIYTLPVNGVPE
jgi:2-oxoglutarate ferredoxin oxidoreductase subunit delta